MSITLGSLRNWVRYLRTSRGAGLSGEPRLTSNTAVLLSCFIFSSAKQTKCYRCRSFSIKVLLLCDMKKAVAIAIGMIYLLLTAGVQIHKHYCCGKLKEVSFTGTPDVCCTSDKGTCSFSHKCCDIKEFNLKIVDEHRNPEIDVLKTGWVGITEFPSLRFIRALSFEEPSVFCYGHAPPIQRELYELHCALIVYG